MTATDPADGLDALSTDELRHRAYSRAQHHADIGFFWGLAKHLPSSADAAAANEGSAGGIGASISEAIELVREMTGHHDEQLEPLLRAEYLDYLRRHGTT